MKTLLNTLKSVRQAPCILLALFSINNALVAQESFVCNDLISISLQSNCMVTVTPDDILEGGPYCCFQDYVVEIDNTPGGTPCDGPWIPATLGSGNVGHTYCVRVRDPFHPNSQCTGLLQVVNNIGPTISCPGSQTRITDPGQCGHTAIGAEFNPTASDNCPGLTLAYKLTVFNTNTVLGTGATTLAGTLIPLGATTIRWTATDVDNNTATCSFTVQVDDTVLPTITCPPNQVRIGDVNDMYTTLAAEFDPLTFFDNCPTYPVSSSLTGATNDGTQLTLAGTVFEAGQTTVTWTLVESLNPNFVFATCSFDVDVQSTRALVYIGNFNSNTISAINPVTHAVTATIPVGTNPVDIRMSPDGSRVYVANRGAHTVSVINTTTNTVMATINVGNFPVALDLSPNGSRLYVSNAQSS